MARVQMMELFLWVFLFDMKPNIKLGDRTCVDDGRAAPT